MGMRLGQQDGYPVGVDNSHPHFHGGGEEVECPACGCMCDGTTGDCPRCGRFLDDDDIRDYLDARSEPEEDWGTDR